MWLKLLIREANKVYYIDRYSRKLIRDKDINPYSPPERYIEYREGFLDSAVKETYIISYKPLRTIDFTYLAYLIPEYNDVVSIQRNEFLKTNGISRNPVLFAYTVPSQWYKTEIEKIKEEQYV